MKQFLPVLLILGAVQLAIGQTKPALPIKNFKDLPACDCSAFLVDGSGYASQEQAQDLVVKMLDKIRRNCRTSFNDRIQVREANCTSSLALLCPTTLTDGRGQDERIILYSNKFLTDVTKADAEITWLDRQVLAHEIGHHVFGHLVNKKTIEAIQRQYNAETGNPNSRLTNVQVSNLHAQEIQADLFSIWLLYRTEKNFNFNTFIKNFDEVTIAQKEKTAGKDYSITHPLFRERLEAMKSFWATLQNDYRQPNLTRMGYFGKAASVAYVNLTPTRTYYDFALVGGATLAGKPEFSVGGTPVQALLYSPHDAFNSYIGLSVSRFNWRKAMRFEGEVAWSRQRYGTLLGNGSGQQLLETLDLRYLTAFPKVSWSTGAWGNTNGFSINRFALFASIGPMFRIPLGIKYDSYGTTVDPANKPKLQPSISPRLSIGVQWLKKTFLPKGYKLAFSYEWQQISLDASPRPKTVSHNVDATLYYTFLRR